MWDRLLEWWRYSWLDTYFTRARRWICDTLFPRQRWLTRLVPNSFSDKTHLIPTLLFAMVIDFVEQEDGLEMLAYQVTSAVEALENFDTQDYGWGDKESLRLRIDSYRQSYRELTLAYRWALIREREFDSASAELDQHIQSYGIRSASEERRELILDSHRREVELYALDEECVVYIARHHRHMWT